MARLKADYVFGAIDTALTSAGTTISSPALARLPVVASPDTLALTLFDAATGVYEIVWVTAHTSAATTATILRAQEGSTAAAWGTAATWSHGPTARDVGTPIVLLESGAATPTTLLPGTLVIEKGRNPVAAILADAPVAYYKMDETTGVFADASGGGRDMTAGAGAVRGVAPINTLDGGFSASGSGTAEIGLWTPGTNIPGLQGTGPMTLECRVRIPAGTVSYKGVFMATGAATTGWDIGIGVAARSDLPGAVLNFGWHGQNWNSTGYVFTPGDFHIVCVRSGPGNLVAYVNGQTVLSNGNAGTPTSATSTGLAIGRIVGDTVGFLSAGIAVDDVAFYDKALSVAQVSAHAGASGPTKFRGWWNGTSLQPLAS